LHHINDPSTPGLQLRVTPQARTWYFRDTWHGSRVRATLGSYPSTGLADARAAAITARSHVKRGIDPRNAGLAPVPTAAPSKLITLSIARCEKRLKAVGVEKFIGHDLTNLARLKIEPHIAERCLNHAAGSVIERTYDVHDYLDERRAALDKWAAHLAAL
jgi:hypothetical protein